MIFLTINPSKIFATESIDSVRLAQDTTFQNEDLDTLDLVENGFDEIVKERFIEGTDDSWWSYFWAVFPITGILMWIGLMIIILYHSYQIIYKIFSKKK